MTLKVNRSISGSWCVIFRTPEHYIDCLKLGENVVRFECVRNGQVYRRSHSDLRHAPEDTLRLVREELLT